MQFRIQRENLLKPLSQVAGIVERRQTLPVLANLLVEITEDKVTVTGTDLEVEMSVHFQADDKQTGSATMPAKKLFDICRALPDGAQVDVRFTGERISVHAGRSRFALNTLPAVDFPQIDDIEVTDRFTIAESQLKELFDRTAFAMAQQDVRYYLNGCLLNLDKDTLRCVATDGHRLALCETKFEQQDGQAVRQVIVPRKGVIELQRLLDNNSAELVQVELGRNHMRLHRADFVFTTKLIDGRYPDYETVMPIGADKLVCINRDAFRSALQRASILSSEKYRGVKLEIKPNLLQLMAHNPEQDEAVEELEVKTEVDQLNIGFNVHYLQDALTALKGEEVVVCFRDGNSSCVIYELNNENTRQVVMPLRL